MSEHREQGERFLDEGNLEAALAAFGRALEDEPSDASTHACVARVHAHKGETEHAVAAYRASLELLPAADTATELAELLLGQGIEDDVPDILGDAIALNPDYGPPYVLLAELATRSGAYDQADAYLRKGVRRGAGLPDSHILAFYQQWVNVLADEQKLAYATEVIASASGFFLHNRPLRLLAAATAESAGEVATAISLYKAALEGLPPGDLRIEVLEKIASLVT